MTKVSEFKKYCHDSLAVKLMLPDLHDRTISLGKKSGFLASIAYCAWLDNNLERLDYLFHKFNIFENSTRDFKNRLEERWLEREENRRRNVALNTTAAICELVAADYIEEDGNKILGLSAIKEDTPDIIFTTKSNEKYYCEVKYLEDSPELYESRVRAAKSTGVDVINPPNDMQTLNYIFSRIADGITQLQKYRIKSRCVFLVFHELAKFHSHETLVDNIYSFKYWYKNEHNKYPGIISDNSSIILRRDPWMWLKKLNILITASMIDFKIKNIKKFTF